MSVRRFRFNPKWVVALALIAGSALYASKIPESQANPSPLFVTYDQILSAKLPAGRVWVKFEGTPRSVSLDVSEYRQCKRCRLWIVEDPATGRAILVKTDDRFDGRHGEVAVEGVVHRNPASDWVDWAYHAGATSVSRDYYIDATQSVYPLWSYAATVLCLDAVALLLLLRWIQERRASRIPRSLPQRRAELRPNSKVRVWANGGWVKLDLLLAVRFSRASLEFGADAAAEADSRSGSADEESRWEHNVPTPRLERGTWWVKLVWRRDPFRILPSNVRSVAARPLVCGLRIRPGLRIGSMGRDWHFTPRYLSLAFGDESTRDACFWALTESAGLTPLANGVAERTSAEHSGEFPEA